MTRLVLLYLALVLGFVPYRQVFRAEWFYHLSLLEIIKIVIVLAWLCDRLLRVARLHYTGLVAKNPLNLAFAGVLGMYAFATALGLIRQPTSGWNNVLRMAAVGVDYFIFFVLTSELVTAIRIQRFVLALLVYGIVATGFVALTQAYPAILPATSEMGVLRAETVMGFKRIFTPGGNLLFYLCVGLLGYLGFSWRERMRDPIRLWLLLGVFFLALIPSFIRSNLLIIFLWAFLVLLPWGLSVRAWVAISARAFAAITIVLVLALSIRGPDEATLARALVKRLTSVTELGQEGEPNTFMTRLIEVGVAYQEMKSPTDRVLGLGFGHVFHYSLLFTNEEWDASVTHNGYFSIFYSHGVVGMSIFLAFLVAVSKRMVVGLRALRGSRLGKMQRGAALVWFSALLANWQSPQFQNPETAVLIVIAIVLGEKCIDLGRREVVRDLA